MANKTGDEGGWERWHDWQAVIMEPVTRWFCDVLEAPRGAAVLDAACGTGLPSLAMAERLAVIDGTVLSIDVSPRMIAAARRKAEAAGLHNLSHREMDLAALSLPDESFDAVTCKDGLMFCAEPVKAAAGLHRVTRKGGQIAVAVPDEPAKNPFFTTLFGAIAQAVPTPPPDPLAPGPFRLSRPGELEATLVEAGYRDVRIERREVWFEFDSVAMHWQVVHDMATPVENAAQSLSDEGLFALKEAIATALRPYTRDGKVRINNTSQCAVGRRG